MLTYWELYVAYINRCVEDNYKNDIDPAHYEMEWNHFWPKCIFGDWPVGQWLTIKQHAIASALQTLVFKENCMYGGHKDYIPAALLELSWPYFCEAVRARGKKGGTAAHAEKDEDGKSLRGLEIAAIAHADKNKDGKSLFAVKGGKASAAIIHVEKDENGKSVHALKAHSEKDENGKSVNGLKAAAASHAEKNENGKSVNAVKGGILSASQIWQSTVDGFTSNAGAVACHNKASGWPKDARIRLS
jgi:hypothetical protein